jgi:hypothetical protein
MWGWCDGRKRKGDLMADGPTTGDEKVVSSAEFKRAQRRRDAKEKRKRENEEKLGPGDATRQFACEMRKDGLHLLKDGVAIWIAQLFEVIGIGRSPIENGVSDTRGIAISFTNRRGQYREVFINGDLLNGDLGRLFSLLYLAGFKFDRHDVYRRAFQRYLTGYVTANSAIVAEYGPGLRQRRVHWVLVPA